MRDSNSAAAAADAHPSPDFVEALSVCRKTAPASVTQTPKVPAKVYGVMALTTMLTFATLTTGYRLLFPSQLFA